MKPDNNRPMIIMAYLWFMSVVALIVINSNSNNMIDSTVPDTTVTTTVIETTTEQVTEPTTQIDTTAASTTKPTVVQTKAETTKPVTQEATVQEAPSNGYYTEQDARDLAKVLWKECRGVNSKTEQACVAWTVLNWVDIDKISVSKEVRKPGRFAFYESTRVDQGMLDLAHDVLDRWVREKNGETDVGRVLPKDYLYFEGHGGHNYFRNAFKGNYTVWDYSLPSPYDT